MKKIIALIGCLALSGCAGNYFDQMTSQELEKYCPSYDPVLGFAGEYACDINIEKNLDQINADRKIKREKLAIKIAEQQRQEEKVRQEQNARLDKIASKFNRSYEGELSDAVFDAYQGGEFNDGLYHIDINVKISYCQRSSCYGSLLGLDVPVEFYNFGNPIVGSYLGGGYHRASVFNGKIKITKVNI